LRSRTEGTMGWSLSWEFKLKSLGKEGRD